MVKARIGWGGSLGAVTLIYVIASLAAYTAAASIPLDGAQYQALAGHLVATLVIYACGTLLSNSSCYDPCWSLAPIAIGLFWAQHPLAAAPLEQKVLVLAVVTIWGLRLTGNFLRRWPGLSEEDWRYEDLRRKWGRLYPLVDLFGVHLFQTGMVFLGSLPLWPLLASDVSLWWLLPGAIVALAAVCLETLADQQLWRFLSSSPPPGAILDKGLWAYSRHPNYFGQMMFWWGLAMMGVAADPSWWWSAAGAVVITLLLVFISIPLMEDRSTARRPGYAAHAKRVAALVPRRPRR